MKKIILGILALTSISVIASEIQLVPGLYVTAADYCDVNVVQTNEEIVFEDVSTPGKPKCSSQGLVTRGGKIRENLYAINANETTYAADIEVLGPKNFTINIINRDILFFKFYEIPSYEKSKKNIQQIMKKLYTSSDYRNLYYQGIAGLGNCKIVECDSGELNIERNNFPSCNTKENQTLTKKLPLEGAEQITKRLRNLVVVGACGL